MKKISIITFIFTLIVNSLSSLFAQQKTSELNRSDLLNIGTISYPNQIEERSDIPFKMLVDKEYQKLLNDTTDYEKFRPTLIFFERGFNVTESNEQKKQFAYITVNLLFGEYKFPKILSEEQKQTVFANIRESVEANLKKTQFKVKKWSQFEFKKISDLTAIEYYYEQTLNNKTQRNILRTNLYDSDIQIEFVLSAPKKEYKKWLSYYNQIIGTFVRKVNIADRLTFEYPTKLRERNDIPFKYLVDKEFRKILGDSINYDKFKPNMLLLDQSFSIEDSLNIAPFGNITVNILPKQESGVLNKDSINLGNLELEIKNNIENNLKSTQYNISNWYPFSLTDISGLPVVKYSYDQNKGGKLTRFSSTSIFEKGCEIQVGMSSPFEDLKDWQKAYEFILSSFHRIIPLKTIGTMLYPEGVEERSDIPFVKLVDEESKRKLGDSINYEKFRPNFLFLEQDFDENDSSQLKSFNSITINTIQGDFSEISSPDSINSIKMESVIKTTEERNLQNTAYTIANWESFEVNQLPHGVRKISYSFLQEKESTAPKYICITYFYTKTCQTSVTLTCNANDYSRWKPKYINLIKSFRLQKLK